jgi:hypothetical protein
MLCLHIISSAAVAVLHKLLFVCCLQVLPLAEATIYIFAQNNLNRKILANFINLIYIFNI